MVALRPAMITSAACRWLLLGLACVGLRSAGREEPRTRPAIQVFSTAEGLPSTTVHDIRPDRDGRLWIATVEGPAVYNGRRWSTLTLPGASGSKWVRVVRQTTDTFKEHTLTKDADTCVVGQTTNRRAAVFGVSAYCDPTRRKCIAQYTIGGTRGRCS